MRSIIAALILTVVIAPSAMAHGGGLDRHGGHNCYVSPCAGEYHYHRGGGSGHAVGRGSHADEVFAMREALEEPQFYVYRGSAVCPFPFTFADDGITWADWLILSPSDRCDSLSTSA